MENITPDYVDFEIGMLLKNKSFNIPIKTFYDKSKRMCSLIPYDKYEHLYNYSNRLSSYFDGEYNWNILDINGEDNIICLKDAFSDATDSYEVMCSAPEIPQVVKWLYLKHNIWITINPKRERDELGKNYMQFDVDIWRLEGEKGLVYYGTELLQFKTPEQAYLEAIKYTLTKLI